MASCLSNVDNLKSNGLPCWLVNKFPVFNHEICHCFSRGFVGLFKRLSSGEHDKTTFTGYYHGLEVINVGPQNTQAYIS